MPPKFLLVWYRLLRSKLSPWSRVLVACWNLVCSEDCDAATTQLMIAFARLDHLGFVSLLNDCLW